MRLQTLGTAQSKIRIDLPLMIEALFCSASGWVVLYCKGSDEGALRRCQAAL